MVIFGLVTRLNCSPPTLDAPAMSKAHPKRRCRWTRTSAALHLRSRSFRSSSAFKSLRHRTWPRDRGTWNQNKSRMFDAYKWKRSETCYNVWYVWCLELIKDDENLQFRGLEASIMMNAWRLKQWWRGSLIEDMIHFPTKKKNSTLNGYLKIGDYLMSTAFLKWNPNNSIQHYPTLLSINCPEE